MVWLPVWSVKGVEAMLCGGLGRDCLGAQRRPVAGVRPFGFMRFWLVWLVVPVVVMLG